MLRIVSGKYRGIRLDEVNSELTRPTTDKNKETLFNILGQYFEGGSALDLYSGSGALGLEAISRGMTSCTFVDIQREAIQTIQKNVAKIKCEETAIINIMKQDCISHLKKTTTKYDLILVDPPYQLDVYLEILDLVSSNELLTESGVLVFESDKSRILPELVNKLILQRVKVTGNTKFHFYMWEDSV
ncbi:MAG: 16S rRNA (guanine(966)-N(2))-methyltransferase RsmD [Candidatus Izemoplasmatales bacterium]|nr:16S rRNA (guanine(966)-N(2))-methyltransferase RsmD [Candidatus Izemoplasmatales bacterium]